MATKQTEKKKLTPEKKKKIKLSENERALFNVIFKNNEEGIKAAAAAKEAGIERTTALGYVDNKGIFRVQYVGRSDTDVNDRIKDHLGENYAAFKFSYATSPKAAFEKECQNYHDFGGSKKLKNNIHPDHPDNSPNWKCPVCE